MHIAAVLVLIVCGFLSTYAQQLPGGRGPVARPSLNRQFVGGTMALARRVQSSIPSSSTPPPVGFAFHDAANTGTAPVATAIADFNGDGNLDWAVAMYGDGSVWLYFGNGDGTAGLPVIIPVGMSPVALLAADFNGDGKIDLVVADAGTNTVGILLGNGDGTFQTQWQAPLTSTPLSLVAGDFDNDGKLDLIVGQAWASLSYPFTFLLGDGMGHFVPRARQRTSALSAGDAIATGDFNNDGKLDLIVVCTECGIVPGQGAVYLGTGDGNFSEAVEIYFSIGPDPHAQSFPTTASVGDLNHDGCADIVLGTTGGTAQAFLGACDGTFTRNGPNGSPYPIGDTVVAGQLVDVNGDGNLDYVASGYDASDIGGDISVGFANTALVSVSLGDGTEKLGTSYTYRVDPSIYGLGIGDLNHDGKPDIVAPSADASTISVLLNDGAGGFGGPAGRGFGHAPGTLNPLLSGASFVDMNGDGLPDLSFLLIGPEGQQPYQFTVMLNRGDGTFSGPIFSPAIPSGGNAVWSYAVGDFRNTGRPDLVIADLSSNLFFAPNMGGGSFGPGNTTSLTNVQFVAPGDFNQDGKLDLIGVGTDGANNLFLTVLAGRGDGTFLPGTPFSMPQPASYFGTAISAIYVDDYNRDGNPDVLVQFLANATGTSLVEFLGNGNGTFQAPRTLFSSLPQFIMADMNGDGCPDIVAPWADPSFSMSLPGISVYLCQRDGSFQLAGVATPYLSFSAGAPFWTGLVSAPGLPRQVFSQMITADFNGDGKMDVAYFEHPNEGQGYAMGILLGNGDGTLSSQFTEFNLIARSAPQYAVDVNRDGKADLIQFDKLTSNVTIVPATLGKSFDMQFRQLPVSGGAGHLRITLAQGHSSAVTINFSASNPGLSLPASVTIAAGETGADVDFTLPGSYDFQTTFIITAALGTEQHSVLGYAVNERRAALEYSPSYLDFGSQLLNVSSAPLTLSIHNYGTYETGITDVSVEAIRWSAGSDCLGMLAPGATCHVQVVFKAPYAQAEGSGVAIATGLGVLDVPLYGFGGLVTTMTVTPSALTFNAAPNTQSPPQTITFTNTGSLPLSLAPLPFDDSHFMLVSNACSAPVPPMQSCTMSLAYLAPAPQLGHRIESTFALRGDFNPTPIHIPITGRLIAGTLSVTPSVLDFGSQAVGSNQTVHVTITNSASDFAFVDSMFASSNLRPAPTCSSITLAGHGSCGFDVTFQPANGNDFTGALRILGTSSTGDFSLPISATWNGFTMSGQAAVTIQAGAKATFNLRYEWPVTAGTVTFSCAGVTNATCSVSPSSAAGTGAADLAVTVTTTAAHAGNRAPAFWPGASLFFATCVAGIVSWQRKPRPAKWLAIVLLSLVGTVSCGGGGGASSAPPTSNSPAATAPGSYTVTVTATSASGKATCPLQLTVQ